MTLRPTLQQFHTNNWVSKARTRVLWMDWVFRQLDGTAADLHRTRLDNVEVGVGIIHLNQLSRDAIVLGSAQQESVISGDIDQYELAKRQTGGGVVHIDAEQDLWIDIYVHPSHVPNSIEQTFDWLGTLWLHTLAELSGLDYYVSNQQPANPNTEAGAWCFSSLGYGEVCAGDHKYVGLSQRRGRDYVRYQCLYSPTAGIAKRSQILGLSPQTQLSPKPGPNRQIVWSEFKNQITESRSLDKRNW